MDPSAFPVSFLESVISHMGSALDLVGNFVTNDVSGHKGGTLEKKLLREWCFHFLSMDTEIRSLSIPLYGTSDLVVKRKSCDGDEDTSGSIEH